MHPFLRRGADITLTVLLSWGWAHLWVLPLCGLLFRCGCTWVWAGGISHCNIYDAALPDCPGCTAPARAAWIPFRGQIIVMTLAALAARRVGAPWWLRAVAAVCAFAVFGLLAGLAFKLAIGYPLFLWFGSV